MKFIKLVLFTLMFTLGIVVQAQQQMPDYVLHAALTLNSQYNANIDVNNVIWNYTDYNLDLTNATINCPRLGQNPPPLNNTRVYRVEFQPVRNGTWGDEIWEAIVWGDLSYVGLCIAPVTPTPPPVYTAPPTLTPSITPTATLTPTPSRCGLLASRLIIGQTARVVPDGFPNNLRSGPGASNTYLGEIPAGAEFVVLDGPRCTTDGAWWQVNYAGTIGWTVEGQNEEYYLEPLATVPMATVPAAAAVVLEPTYIAPPIQTICDATVPPRLHVGEQGRNMPGLPNIIRASAGKSSAYVNEIPSGGVFTVLDGPECTVDGAWWQVDYAGNIGWTLEGQNNEYWLEPELFNITPMSIENINLLSPLAIITNEETTSQIVHFDGHHIYVGGTDLRLYNFVLPFSQVTNSTWNLSTIYSDTGSIETFRKIEDALLIINTDGEIHRLFNPVVREMLGQLSPSTNPHYAISPDGNFVAYLNATNQLMLNDVRLSESSGLTLSNISIEQYLVFSPDNRWFLAVASNEIRIWDTSTWAVQRSIQQTTFSQVNGVSFFADSQQILVSGINSATGRGDLVIYDVDSGMELDRLSNHQTNLPPTLTAPLISPDGNLIVAADAQSSTFFFWDAGANVLSVQQESLAGVSIHDLAMSDDGLLLATVSNDGILRLWGVPLQG